MVLSIKPKFETQTLNAGKTIARCRQCSLELDEEIIVTQQKQQSYKAEVGSRRPSDSIREP
jgi:hypothetical protein